MCDWCRESLPASSSVTDMNGNLKFCTFLCLNKYKMNLFCTEAQQHLPRLQKEMSIPSPVNEKSTDKKLLITPDLWLSDGNSSDHTMSESRKRQKINLLDASDKHSPTDSIRDSDSKSSRKFTPPPPLHRDLLRNGFPSSKCSNGITRKRHKASNNIPDSSSEFTKRFHNDSEETRSLRPANKSTPKSYEPKNLPKPSFPTDDAPDGNGREQYNTNMWMNNPNLPFLFLPPWYSSSLSNPGLANILPHGLFPTMQNFQNIQPPFVQSTQHTTQPQHRIPTPHTATVPYPFIIPIPIPVPIIIPANIQKSSSKPDASVDRIAAVVIEPEVIKERFSPIDDSTCSSYNQAIDFSITRNKKPKQDPSISFSSNSSPLSSKSPQFTIKIKTEPEELHPVQLTSNHQDMRPSYASRRNLILDAPPPSSQSKTIPSLSYVQTPKRFSHNRKRCASAQIRSK